MFRVLLTAYVTAVMLAGPSVCCCTTARALAGVFVGETDTADDVPACCCRQGSQCEKSAPADDDGSSAPADEKHECPCRAHKTHAVAEARKQVAELQQFRLLFPFPLDLPTCGRTVVDVAERNDDPQVENRASHFGSSREILRALRNLLL